MRLAALLLLLPLAAACGHDIGDACSLASDCASDGTRICDTTSFEGYCTIQGCDFGTCPEGSVCVRFFPVSNLTRACAQPSDCTLDEVCSLGKCAPRASEVRFCMATCGGHGDCRDGYECRNQPRQEAHGGEPVPDPDGIPPDVAGFCGEAPNCSLPDDPICAALGDTCDLSDVAAGKCTPTTF